VIRADRPQAAKGLFIAAAFWPDGQPHGPGIYGPPCLPLLQVVKSYAR